MQQSAHPRLVINRAQARGWIASLPRHTESLGRDKRGRMVLLSPAKRTRDGGLITYSNTRELVFQ